MNKTTIILIIAFVNTTCPMQLEPRVLAHANPVGHPLNTSSAYRPASHLMHRGNRTDTNETEHIESNRTVKKQHPEGRAQLLCMCCCLNIVMPAILYSMRR